MTSTQETVFVRTGAEALLPSGILLGHAHDADGATGCTAVLCPEGAVGSVAVYGGAPATRETDLLAPENMVQSVHAVVLSGGSAFGLDASTGVMRFLEEQGWGLSFSGATVPIVAAASLFDLDLVTAHVRPDAEMGYGAATAAQSQVEATGNVGAGTGASVGRFLGPQSAMKGGFGAASVEADELMVSALIAVNSLGSVYDRKQGCYVAGAYIETEGKKVLVDPIEVLPRLMKGMSESPTNTTIGVVATNARVSKADARRIAGMAHDGLARALYPAHTSFDGDAVFTLATNHVAAQADLVGSLAARAIEEAILDAVYAAEAAYGLPSATSLKESNPHT